MVFQPEDVGGRVQPVKPNKFDNRLFAQPLDVHRPARHEVPQPLDDLRRAYQPASAAHIHFALLGNRFGAAFGAVIGEGIDVAGLVAGEVLDHLRDYVARALNPHPVADA